VEKETLATSISEQLSKSINRRRNVAGTAHGFFLPSLSSAGSEGSSTREWAEASRQPTSPLSANPVTRGPACRSPLR
jgi:hypothetical protein